jgi:tetratricopeptide (TPR) repeat protein
MVWANLARAYREQPEPTPPNPTETYARQIRNIQLLTHAKSLAENATHSVGLLSEINLTLGYAYEEQGQRVDAERLYEEAVTGDPANAQAWRYLGALKLREGDLRAAMEAANRAIEIYPTDPENLELRARILAAAKATASPPARP